jgi:subtilisin family serine protease
MKILIPDTLGSTISPAYRALLPSIAFRGIDHPEIVGDHPHGAWCGWLCGAPLQAAGVEDVEIVFLQLLSADGAAPDFQERLLETIEAERPDYISMSWGSWDRQDELTRAFLSMRWSRYAERFAALRADIGFTAFAAAGNDDRNNAGHDVAYPQAMQTDDVWVIGSTNARGIPSEFSGDGPVDAVAIGEQCLSPDQAGAWHLWRGTSAACPKVCGAMAAVGIRHNDMPAVLLEAEHPGTYTRPHPKWGWGSLEESWQSTVAALPPEIHPPRHLAGVLTTHASALDGRGESPSGPSVTIRS